MAWRVPARAAQRLRSLFLVAVLMSAVIVPAVPAHAILPDVSGVVTAAGGGALEGVEVALWDMASEGDPVAITYTSATGSYSFDGIPNGSYGVTFWLHGYEWTILEFEFTGTALTDLDAAMVPLPLVVSGILSDASSAWPIEGAWVDASRFNAVDEYFEWVGSGTSNVDGEYTVYDEMGVGAGDYELWAYAGGYYDEWVYDSWDGSTSMLVNIALNPKPVVASGTVKDSVSTLGVPYAWVESYWYNSTNDWYEWSAWADCDENGAYTLYDDSEWGWGDYWFRAGAPTYRFSEYTDSWNGVDSIALDPVLVPADQIASGTVTDADTGDPVFGAAVDASWYNDVEQWYEWAGSGWTDDLGDYTVYDEYAYGAGEYEFWATSEFHDEEFAYETWDGSTVLDVDFQLAPKPPLAAGTVTDALTGDPIMDAGVDALAWDEFEGGYMWTGSAWTDEFGQYQVYDQFGYGANDYQFLAFMDGYSEDMVQTAWDGAETLSIDFQLVANGELLPTPVSGDNRFETAVQASQLAFPIDGSCGTAVVASGRNFPDALGGSALAGAMGGPVLLTEPTSLPGEVADEIERLGVSKVIVVGGAAAVSNDVKAAIDALPGVATERIFGDNRYETARDIAQRTVDELGPAYDGRIMFATGTNFPDALAAAPLAATGGTPILLVKPTEIPDATYDALDYIAPGYGIVLGGESAVGAGVYGDLEAELADIERVAGTNRYETAAAIAQYGVDNYGLMWNGVAFATGLNFPDALAGGATQGLTGSVVLLTKPTSLEPAPEAKIAENAADISEVRYFGGLAAISQTVRDDIEATILANKP